MADATMIPCCSRMQNRRLLFIKWFRLFVFFLTRFAIPFFSFDLSNFAIDRLFDFHFLEVFVEIDSFSKVVVGILFVFNFVFVLGLFLEVVIKIVVEIFLVEFIKLVVRFFGSSFGDQIVVLRKGGLSESGAMTRFSDSNEFSIPNFMQFSFEQPECKMWVPIQRRARDLHFRRWRIATIYRDRRRLGLTKTSGLR